MVEQAMRDYRTHLVLAEQKAQEDYDKTLLALSGGALGISFAFMRDFAGEGHPSQPWLLFLAWLLWALSLLAVLASYFASQLALRTAIRQADADSIYDARPGGVFDRVTATCNFAGAALFLAGVASMGAFMWFNLGDPT